MEKDLGRRAVLVLLAALMLLHLAAYPFATVLLDASRDLSQAWAIVQGVAPLLGPRIDDRFHLGPAWFYVLALPLWLTKSTAATLAAAGLLAALKYPLAYLCGKRLLDARFGLFWAVALALPGWNLLQPMFPTHTILIETTMLAALLPLIRLWQRGEAHWWGAYGMLQGLALHAHPATALLVPLAVAVAWQRRAAFRHEAGPIAGGVALALLPFAPMLWHEATHGWPMLETLFARGAPGGLATAPELARGVFVQGPVSAFAAGGRAWILVASLLYPVLALTLVAGLAFAIRRQPALWRVPLCAVLALLLLAALGGRTPFHLVYAWLPFGAATLALGWWGLWHSPRARPVATAAAAACVALALCATTLQIRAAHAGQTTLLAGSVADVRTLAPPRRVPLLPAFLLDQWGREICTANRATVLHGDLALLMDAARAISVRLACDRADLVNIGGGADVPDAAHVAGLTPGQRRVLGEAQAGWPQAFSDAPLRVVASGPTTPVAAGDPRTRSTHALQSREFEFMAPRGAAVAISLPFAAWDEARIESVGADGFARTPVLAGAATRVFRCDDCTGVAVQWRVVVRTREPDRLDIVVITPAAAVSPD